MEVLVAFSVLMIVILPLSYLLDTLVSQAASVRQHEAALEIADQWMEILSNSTPPTNATTGAVQTGMMAAPTDPDGVVSPVQKVGGTTYSTQAEYNEQLATGDSDNLCSAKVPSSANPGVIVVQVTVSWDKGSQNVTDATNLQYPQPGVQTDGFIAVQVSTSGLDDQNGVTASSRVQAVPVTITNTSVSPTTSQTLNPDSAGCVFDQVLPDNYSVALGQPAALSGKAPFPAYSGTPSFVNTTNTAGNALPANNTSTVTVSVTQESAVNVTFDEGLNPTVSYASSTPIQDGVECPGTNALACVTTGTGSGTSAVATAGTSSTWTSGTVSGATRITAVACTSAATPTCVGVGNTASGSGSAVIVSGTGPLSSATVYSGLPTTIASLSQVVCPSTDGCYAIGTSTSGTPVLLAGSFVGAPIWQQITDSAQTFTTLTSIACAPSPWVVPTCELAGTFKKVTPPATTASAGILRLDGDPGALGTILGTLATPTFTLDSVPTGLTGVGSISCPSATPAPIPTTATCEAIGTGDASGATDPVILTASPSSTAGTASSWTAEADFPALSAKTLTGLSCTTNACMAIGTTTSGAAAWQADMTQSPHAWQQVVGLPSSVTSLTGVACGAATGTDLGDCAMVGSGTATNSGTLLSSSLQGTSGSGVWTTLNTVALPTALLSQVEYFTGIACEIPSAGSECAAVGATPSGPFVITSSSGTGGTWSASTPASLQGSEVSSIPVEIKSTTSWSTQALNSSLAMTTTLYPQQSGYSIAAGDCSAEGSYVDTLGSVAATGVNGTFSAVPGSTPTATVPLGILPLDVLSPTGVPVAGARVTLAATSYIPPVLPATTPTACTADSYTMPTTGPDGLSRTAVPFGLYTATITSGATTTTVQLMVGLSTVTTMIGATTTQYPLPSAASVVL